MEPQQQNVARHHHPMYDSRGSEDVRNWCASVLSGGDGEEGSHERTTLGAARGVEAVVESRINDDSGPEPPGVVVDMFGHENHNALSATGRAADEGAGRNETALGGPQVEEGTLLLAQPPMPLSSASLPLPLAPLSPLPPPATATADPYSFRTAWDQGLPFRGCHLPARFPNARNAVVSAGNLKDDPVWQASPLSNDTLLMEELSSGYFAFLTMGNNAQQQWGVLNPAVFQHVCQQFARLGGSQPSLERLGRRQVPKFVQFCHAYARAEGKSGGFKFRMAPKKPNATATTAKKFLQLKKQKTLMNNNNNETPWWEQLMWHQLPLVDITDDMKLLGDKLEPLFRKQKDDRQAAQQQQPMVAAVPPQETSSGGAVRLLFAAAPERPASAASFSNDGGGDFGQGVAAPVPEGLTSAANDGGGDFGQGVTAPAPAPEGSTGAEPFSSDGGGDIGGAAASPEGLTATAFFSNDGGDGAEQGVAAEALAPEGTSPRFIVIGEAPPQKTGFAASPGGFAGATFFSGDGGEGVGQGAPAPDEGPVSSAQAAAAPACPLPPRFISIGGYLYERKRPHPPSLDGVGEVLGAGAEEEETGRLYEAEASSRAPLDRTKQN